MNQCQFFQDNQSDFVLPTVLRGVSEENFFSCFFGNKFQNDEPMIVAEIEPVIPQKQIEIPNFNSYKRGKEAKRKEQSRLRKDYKKNICGYITKKIVREFMAPNYKQKVLSLCDKYGCDYEECLAFYDKKIERITGPTHLDMLLNVSKQDSHMKKCFKEFFIWFLRHRYLRYLMSEGKMQKKELYVDYKNKTLLYLGSMEEECDYFPNFAQSQSKDTASIF